MKKIALKKALQEQTDQDRTAEQPIEGILETVAMSDKKHISWCRTGEVSDHQLEQWKKNVVASIKPKPGKGDTDKTGRLKQRIASLKEALSPKDKALAQTTDLLVIKKDWRYLEKTGERLIAKDKNNQY